jgi:hypothetical protein
VNRTTHSLAIGVVVTLFVCLVLAVPLAQFVRAEAPGTWNVTTSYPQSVEGASCATDGSYIYCVGGDSGGLVDTVYSAPLSSSGIGTWTLQTNNFPTSVYLTSCAISGGYIYCVGGLVGSSTNTDAVYYAHLTSGTVGTWGSGTNYPTNIEATSCVISGGYIYCVAGLTVPAYVSTITNAVYYAQVSSSGVGAWSSTTNYPIADNLDTCAVSGGFIICMGGEYDMTHGFVTGDAYYDTISSSGVGGTWSSTTAYPSNSGSGAGSCAISGGYMYCVVGYGESGDTVNYAAVSSGTLSTWTAGSTEYPVYALTDQVVIAGGYIYTVGGQTNAAYYAAIGAGTSTTTSSTSSTSTSTSSSSTTSTSTAAVPVCPSTAGGVYMPVGATFMDTYGNTWLAPSGSLGGGTLSSYFFAGPQSSIPPPMMAGWGGVYGTYSGQAGWIITFFCA